jgi:hypothetical protein
MGDAYVVDAVYIIVHIVEYGLGGIGFEFVK